MKRGAVLWRLAVAVAVAAVVLIALSNIITAPVTSETRIYVADFTDASGLQHDGDVRIRGVRVGKVEAIELKRRDDQNVAAVTFTVDKKYGIVPVSRVAIKFQALTGVRYMDLTNPAEGYSDADLVTKVPTSMTQPSFDVTELFNGLQPVLATLSPEEVNTFTANAASFLSGDDTGLAPLLDSLRRLTEFVANRQQVVSALVHNLATISDGIRGKSKELTYLVEQVETPINGALDALDEFRRDFVYGNFFNPATRLLKNAGLRNGTDIDKALDRAFSNLDNFFDAIKLVPVFYENIPPPSQDESVQPCTRGPAQLPETMDVLLNGRRVVLCNR
jgi:phospholipid/cholesterol/gamma-HCH transport system substrate-binding protein